MTIKKASYSKTYPISNLGVWEKIYLEADINEGEDVRQALYALKKQVENFHFESNKAAEKAREERIELNKITPDGISTLEDQIKSCGELKILESYKLIIKGNTELETVYNNRLKELT